MLNTENATMMNQTCDVEIVIGGQWTRVHAACSEWLARLVQSDLEYRHGETARIVRRPITQ